MYGWPDTCLFLVIFTILNGCILFNIGPINTKLDDFVKLGVLC